MKRNTAVLAVAVCLLAAACGSSDIRADTTTTTSVTITSTTIESSTTTETVLPAEQELVDNAVADLAERLGIGREEVALVQVESITWPDAALGCPEEDQMYAQVITEGHRIVLGHDERIYVYHAGGDQPPFLCPSEERDGGFDFVPPPGAGES